MHSTHSPRSRLAFQLLTVLVVAAGVLSASCGSAASSGSRADAPLPVLPASALAGLTAVDTQLSATDLTHDAPISGFASRLSDWGYQRGAQRVFRGNTGDFTSVVSRTLEFASAAGAGDYVRLVADRVADFFGRGSKVAALSESGRSGYLIRAAQCGCHLETPVLLAVLTRGHRVTWLYGTGPGARPKGLLALLAQAP